MARGVMPHMDVCQIGDFKGGWFIGDFAPAVLQTSGFEVGWKVHRLGEDIAPHMHHKVTEYNLVALGEMNVNGHRLTQGTLFVLHAGERVDAAAVTAEVHVVCVKVPSVPEDKEICEP